MRVVQSLSADIDTACGATCRSSVAARSGMMEGVYLPIVYTSNMGSLINDVRRCDMVQRSGNTTYPTMDDQAAGRWRRSVDESVVDYNDEATTSCRVTMDSKGWGTFPPITEAYT